MRGLATAPETGTAGKGLSCPVFSPAVTGAHALQEAVAGLPIPAGIFGADGNHPTEMLNRRFTRVFGYTEEDIRSLEDLSETAYPEHAYREKMREVWERALEAAMGGSGSLGARRCRIVSKGGGVRHAVVGGTVHGERILLTFLDTTERAPLPRARAEFKEAAARIAGEAEAARVEAEEQRNRLERTLEALIDPHVILEPVRDPTGLISDWTVRHANHGACAYWHTSPTGAIGRSIVEFTAPGHLRAIMAWCRDVAATGEPLIINDYAYGKSLCGEERRFDIRISCIDGSVSWTWRDATERCRAARNLHESEEKYRLLAQNSSDVVVLTDENQTVKWVSPSITRMLGWEVRDWIGRACTEFFADGEEIADYERHRETVVKKGGCGVIRKRLMAKDGTVHWVEAHTGPHRGAEGGITGEVASFRTIDRQVAVEEELTRMARRDELTKLLTRREAFERLGRLRGQTERTGARLAVLFVDFDKFKDINDTHGHAAGDAVLQTMGERIHGSLRTEDDIGARVGGDEMLVVLHGVHGLEDAVAVAEKIRLKAAEPVEVSGASIRATVSIGVTMADPEEETEDLIARADDAMYRAKSRGRNQVVTIHEKTTPARLRRIAGQGGGAPGSTSAAEGPAAHPAETARRFGEPCILGE